MESKRKSQVTFCLIVTMSFLPVSRSNYTSTACENVKCLHGSCTNGTCTCKFGWGGLGCDHCSGRVRLTSDRGYITDGFGNYSDNSKCTWLIDPGPEYAHSTIRLRFQQFSTECSWDHLYIYDGDSVYSNLLGVYSGYKRQDLIGESIIDEVTAKSGKAFLYFYSDAANHMAGFNISYKIGGCPNDCSNHGECNKELNVCVCSKGWDGPACESALCPNNCSGDGICKNGECVCDEGHRGSDCSVGASQSVWSKLKVANSTAGRASSAAVLVGEDVYISGGYTLNTNLNFLSKFNIPTQTWSTIEPSDVLPADRYDHSLVEFENKLYMFGGVVGNMVTDELWIYDISLNMWAVRHNNEPFLPIAVSGHVAHVVNKIMYVIFGHSPVYGYINQIQEYHILNDAWYFTKTRGAIVKGRYGHASALDPETQLIYVYGGYYYGHPSNEFYVFNTSDRSWTMLRNNERPRYLHSAVIMNGIMLVYAGNTHSSSPEIQEGKCYSSGLVAYDIKCNKWYDIHSSLFPTNEEKYGHVAVSYRRDGISSMYTFGGFNGIMQNSILKFTPGNCTHYSENECLTSKQGDKCVWVFSMNRCMTEMNAKNMSLSYMTGLCHPQEERTKICKQIESCDKCTSTVYHCRWCNNTCMDTCTLPDISNSTNDYLVPHCPHAEHCSLQNNCHACQIHDRCRWIDGKCTFFELNSESNIDNIPKKTRCEESCYLHTTCDKCTQNSCMWCSNNRRCVNAYSYVPSFIYGQCMDWITDKLKCPATRCSDLQRCSHCLSNPMCGWCNHPSNTGIGRCIEGGDKGPVNQSDASLIDSKRCQAEEWFFTHCPGCQCNGHSECTNYTGVCDACQHMTEGKHCDVCQEGYFGNPVNGGNCSACDCNGQADICDRITGACKCRTRGVIGEKCDRCNEALNYFGNPKNGHTCYYNLTTDYQYTFNLSKKKDQLYTQINFMNIPSIKDRDVDFTINCSGVASVNVSIKTKSQKDENVIVSNYPCSYLKFVFKHRDYLFGPAENTTILVSVYGFQTPFWLQISLSQFPKIDLVYWITRLFRSLFYY